MVIAFIVAVLTGVPIAYILGFVGMIGLAQMGPDFFLAVPQRLFSTANNYSLLAIPMFILAGELLGLSGDVERLMNLCRSLIGKVKGGIAYVTIIVGMMLGGLLGMANAEAALLGTTLYPEMLKDGYEEDFAACFIGSVSIIGPLIPPGLLYVIYGVAAGTSIADLFLAGIIPGVLVGLALGGVIFFFSRKRNCNWKTTTWGGWKNVWNNLKGSLFSVFAPFLTVMTVAVGIATPTEAASIIVIAVVLAGIILYKKITLNNLIPMVIRSAVTSGSILIISSMAGVLGWILAIDQIPQKVASAMISISDSPAVVLSIIQVFLLIVGMFMDPAPAVMILVPVFLPLIRQYHYDPVHFGLLVCFNLSIGVLSPPVGTCLYTTALTTGVPVGKMIRSIWPWLAVLALVLFLCTYFQDLVLFFPRLIHLG
jgi:tripartite ATP-independent transporter DctM subunit